jgi:hypothetical protein
MRMFGAVLCGAVLVVGLGPMASADEHDPGAGAAGTPMQTEATPETGGQTAGAGEPGVTTRVAVSEPEDTSDGPPLAGDPEHYPSLDVPSKPWAYDTGYFFALTRGLDEERLSTWERRASMAGTVPLDVVGLPTAAIAGLFGS